MSSSSSRKLLIDLFDAYYRARQNKRRTHNAAEFELDFESRLFALHREIVERTYTVSRSIAFIVQYPVHREVFAADFRDRVIHHLVYGYLSPLFERTFIYDAYSCRVGKGTALGRRRIAHFIRSCSRNYTRDCYILKVDILGYFMNMDRSILYTKIDDMIARPPAGLELDFDVDTVRWLLHKIVFHDPTASCHIKGDRSDWKGLPRTKSLFYAERGKGFPIGNLTSQLFGNVYLHDFDRFMRGTNGCRYYGRYVDDIIVVHESKEFLRALIPRMQVYLERELKLSLHPHKVYLQHYRNGVAFLGQVQKPGRQYLGKRTKGAFYRSVVHWNGVLEDQGGSLSEDQAKSFMASMNSYLGATRAVRAHRLRMKMFAHLAPGFWRYIAPDATRRKVVLRPVPGEHHAMIDGDRI